MGLAGRLNALVQAGNLHWQVIFVDDGSKDNTGHLLSGIAATHSWAQVIHHENNKGLGAALRTGFAAARSPIICTVDSDCTYPPERLPELIQALNRGSDIATASPWHPDVQSGEVPWHRKLMSQAASVPYGLVLGRRIYTFTSMFRAYSQSVIESVRFESNGFPAVTEILVKGLLAGFKIEEIPIPLGTRRHGESKMNFQQAIYGHLELLSKCVRWKMKPA